MSTRLLASPQRMREVGVAGEIEVRVQIEKGQLVSAAMSIKVIGKALAVAKEQEETRVEITEILGKENDLVAS